MDLLAVQGTLKSLLQLQRYNSKALIRQRSAFFMVTHVTLSVSDLLPFRQV